MKFLKKTFAAAMIGAALAAPATALADHDATPFTEDEKKTLQLVRDFQRCTSAKLHAIPGEEINAEVNSFIRENGGSVTKKELSDFVQQKYLLPAQAECFDELDINVKEMGKKLEDLVRTHGPEVGSRPKVPAPQR